MYYIYTFVYVNFLLTQTNDMVTLKQNIQAEFKYIIDNIRQAQASISDADHLNAKCVGKSYIDNIKQENEHKIEELTNKLLHQIAIITKEIYIE